MSKKEIKALAKKLEEITGIKCVNVNQLRHNGSGLGEVPPCTNVEL